MKLDSQLAYKLWEISVDIMRKAGTIVLIVGLIITIITGFNYVTKETVVEIGDTNVTTDRTHSTDWSPLTGLVVMAAGGVFYMFGGKEQ